MERLHFPTESPYRLYERGFDDIDICLTDTLVSGRMQRGFQALGKLTTKIVNDPESVPLTQLYAEVNYFTKVNREELEELRLHRVLKVMEQGIVMHGNIDNLTAYQIDSANRDLASYEYTAYRD